MCDQNGCPISDAVFALDKAIEALSADRPQEKMSDPIRREDAIGAINGWLKQNGFPNLGDGILYLVPSADRPQGEWIDKGWKGDWQFETDGRGHCWKVFECSVCNGWDTRKTRFCPHCGARMKGADDD